MRRHGDSPVRGAAHGRPDLRGAGARAVAARTYEFTQFLVDVLGQTDVGAVRHGHASAYHACCHGLRGLGVTASRQRCSTRVQRRSALPARRSRRLLRLRRPVRGEDGGHLRRDAGAQARSRSRPRRRHRRVTDVSCAMHMNGGLHRRGSPVRVSAPRRICSRRHGRLDERPQSRPLLPARRGCARQRLASRRAVQHTAHQRPRHARRRACSRLDGRRRRPRSRARHPRPHARRSSIAISISSSRRSRRAAATSTSRETGEDAVRYVCDLARDARRASSRSSRSR